jgi:hypothetical protein
VKLETRKCEHKVALALRGVHVRDELLGKLISDVEDTGVEVVTK